MVQHVETLARIAGSQGALDLADDLRQVAEKNRGQSPEVLEGVTIYDISSEERFYNHSNFRHNRGTRDIVRPGKEDCRLTPTEHRLLIALEYRPNFTFRRDELYKIVLGLEDSEIADASHYIKSLVCKLRKKLGDDNPKNPQIVKTVWGKGYYLYDPSKLNFPS